MPHYENVPFEVPPFEVPEGWVWCRLDDIAFIGTGATPSTSNKSYYDKGNIAWISSGATNQPFINEASNFITEKALSETNCKIYPIGTLIVAMYGEGKTRGQVSELSIEAATNQACAAIKPYVLEIKSYIKLYLESNYLYLRKLAEGGNQPNLSVGKISAYTIPLPPLVEQRRIVSEIEHWFSLINIIEGNKEDLQASIKQAKSKIFDLAIHGKLVPQDSNDEPASELLKRINPKVEITCDNGHYPFKIPKKWIMCKLGDVCTLENGYAFSRDDYKQRGIPLIRISNISDNVVNLNGCALVQKEVNKKFIIKNGDLLIALSGATTGKMGIYRNENIAYLNQRVGNLKIKDNVLIPEYRNYYMFSQIKKILKLAYGGAQPNISSKVIYELQFMLPPLSEQQRIIQNIEKLFSVLDNIQNTLEA